MAFNSSGVDCSVVGNFLEMGWVKYIWLSTVQR